MSKKHDGEQVKDPTIAIPVAGTEEKQGNPELCCVASLATSMETSKIELSQGDDSLPTFFPFIFFLSFL